MPQLVARSRWLMAVAMGIIDLAHVFEYLEWTTTQLAAVNGFLVMLFGSSDLRTDVTDWQQRRGGNDYGE